MKCPTCKCASKVLATREEVNRRRQCVNGHRFGTVEIVAVELPNIRLLKIKKMLTDGDKPVAVSHELGVSESWVRRVRTKMHMEGEL